jgi:hypothetical protein
MKQRKIDWCRLHRAAFFALIYALVATIVLNVFMGKWSFRDGSPRYGLERMLRYDVDKPWAGRLLMPWMVNTVFAVLPAKAAIAGKLREHPSLFRAYVADKPELKPDAWSDDAYVVKYHIAYALTFLALFVVLILVRLLTRAVYPEDLVGQEIGPILFGLLLPFSFRGGGYIYDFPELAFFCATLLLMWKRHYWLCLVLMPLAALNKESILLWPAICAPVIWFGSAAVGPDVRAKRIKATLIWVGLFTLAVLPVYWGVRAYFADNPGSWLELYWQIRDKPVTAPATGSELHLLHNLRYWTHPGAWLGIEEIYAPMAYFPQAQNLIVLTILAGFVLFRWNSKPPAVRWSLIISAAIAMPLVLVIGYLGELRALSVMFPFLYLAAVETLTFRYRHQPQG